LAIKNYGLFFQEKEKRLSESKYSALAESHVPCFQERVGTRHPRYMIPDRLPWRLRARPSATLHEIQVRSEERTCSCDGIEASDPTSRGNSFTTKRTKVHEGSLGIASFAFAVEMWLEKISTETLMVRESFVPFWEIPAVAGSIPSPGCSEIIDLQGRMSDKIFRPRRLGAKYCGQRS
jgi:hypothetical protein